MPEANKPFVIVVGVDFSETSDMALDHALELAQQRPTELHALHVLPLNLPGLSPSPTNTAATPPLPAAGEAAAHLKEHVETRARTLLGSRTTRPAARLVTHIRLDAPNVEVAQLAADLEADLIIVGTHGRQGVSRLFLGSVAEATVRHAPCPVLVVRKKAPPEPAPAIEPPCPRCVEARRASGGTELWCEQHRERHGQRHTYHQGDRASAGVNMPLLIR